MSSLALPLLVAIFLGCAAVIWIAGVRLSDTTDVLDDRLHLGSALGGVVLLAIATNLPEIAITVAAAASHHIGVAIGNILGVSPSRPWCWWPWTPSAATGAGR